MCISCIFSLRQMLAAFKRLNDSWERTTVIMTDKDMTERSVLAEVFPDATLQLCLFRTLREFSMDKMGQHAGWVTQCWRLWQGWRTPNPPQSPTRHLLPADGTLWHRPGPKYAEILADYSESIWKGWGLTSLWWGIQVNAGHKRLGWEWVHWELWMNAAQSQHSLHITASSANSPTVQKAPWWVLCLIFMWLM